MENHWEIWMKDLKRVRKSHSTVSKELLVKEQLGRSFVMMVFGLVALLIAVSILFDVNYLSL